jgi:hypothetical protein
LRQPDTRDYSKTGTLRHAENFGLDKPEIPAVGRRDVAENNSGNNHPDIPQCVNRQAGMVDGPECGPSNHNCRQRESFGKVPDTVPLVDGHLHSADAFNEQVPVSLL